MVNKIHNIVKFKKRYILLFSLLVLAIMIYRLIGWTKNNFADLTMDQIVFHILVPLEGTDSSMIRSALNYVIVPTMVSISLIGLVLLVQSKTGINYFLNIDLIKSGKRIKITIWSKQVLVRGLKQLTMTLFILSLVKANNSFALQDYISNQFSNSSFIEDNYVDPNGLLTFPDQKRNLIYIYLESMESTYASLEYNGAFEDNYIPELIEIADQNISFSNGEGFGGYLSTPGAGWTMGAMFAHSTGLPLKLPIQGNNMSEFSEFFPGVVTIGDILKEHGYSNNLLIGSDATFGGRRVFYTQHGEYDIYDYNRAVTDGKIPEDYQVWWGYEDEKLFSFAKELLNDLKNNEEPFNLTMLTVDTHAEDGYKSDLCEDTFDEQYANVIACSSRQVSDFVDWVKKQDFYDNTTIVLVGDHLTMDVDFLDDIDEDYERTVYNAFINSSNANNSYTKNRMFTAYDLFPTTLSSLGVDIKGNRLGLGVDMFSGERTLLEEYGEIMYNEIYKNSSYYSSKFIGGKGMQPYTANEK